jgi:hypothetical protein
VSLSLSLYLSISISITISLSIYMYTYICILYGFLSLSFSTVFNGRLLSSSSSSSLSPFPASADSSSRFFFLFFYFEAAAASQTRATHKRGNDAGARGHACTRTRSSRHGPGQRGLTDADSCASSLPLFLSLFLLGLFRAPRFLRRSLFSPAPSSSLRTRLVRSLSLSLSLSLFLSDAAATAASYPSLARHLESRRSVGQASAAASVTTMTTSTTNIPRTVSAHGTQAWSDGTRRRCLERGRGGDGGSGGRRALEVEA